MTTFGLPTMGDEKTESVSATTKPIDLATLFSRCMGNVSFALALLDELETSVPQQIDKLVVHANSDQPIAVAETAHSLKGAAGIIGADPLRKKAAEIEMAARAGGNVPLEKMIHELQSELDRCLDYIPILRTDLQVFATQQVASRSN